MSRVFVWNKPEHWTALGQNLQVYHRNTPALHKQVFLYLYLLTG